MKINETYIMDQIAMVVDDPAEEMPHTTSTTAVHMHVEVISHENKQIFDMNKQIFDVNNSYF